MIPTHGGGSQSTMPLAAYSASVETNFTRLYRMSFRARLCSGLLPVRSPHTTSPKGASPIAVLTRICLPKRKVTQYVKVAFSGHKFPSLYWRGIIDVLGDRSRVA